jgi:hypothetical protein
MCKGVKENVMQKYTPGIEYLRETGALPVLRKDDEGSCYLASDVAELQGEISSLRIHLADQIAENKKMLSVMQGEIAKREEEHVREIERIKDDKMEKTLASYEKLYLEIDVKDKEIAALKAINDNLDRILVESQDGDLQYLNARLQRAEDALKSIKNAEIICDNTGKDDTCDWMHNKAQTYFEAEKPPESNEITKLRAFWEWSRLADKYHFETDWKNFEAEGKEKPLCQ